MFDDLLKFFLDQENAHIIRLFSSIGTWCLIFGGWFVVNRHHNIREFRKELRAGLDQMKDFVHEINSDSVRYHTEASKEHDAYSIVSKFKRLNRRINRLPFSQHEKNNMLCMSMRFKQAVTLYNFESNSYVRQSLDSWLVGEIEHASENLIDEMEYCFINKFR